MVKFKFDDRISKLSDEQVYIPIWLNSNAVMFGNSEHVVIVYIPIWLNSNFHA